MKYKQITAADRKAIEVLLSEDYSTSQIAKKLGFNRSTICREVKNRSNPNGYSAFTAQCDYEDCRKRCVKTSKLNISNTQNYVYEKLTSGWSPEQISGRMRLEQRADYVCHETIYNFIYTNPVWKKDSMYQYLRLGKKKRVSWKGRKTHKSKIPNRVSIHKRSKIVDKRIEIGHYEGDSVIYPYGKVINTLNELKTGRVIFTLLPDKTTKETIKAVTNQLKLEDFAKTLTVDNGTEFTEHKEVTKQAGVKVYFADPYSSWQRGANENCNMLLRGFLPKRHNINNLKQEELDEIAEELNNRPRKRLGYKTPNEVYFDEVLILKNVAVGVRM